MLNFTINFEIAYFICHICFIVAQGDKAHQKENVEKLIDVDICGMDNHCTYSVSYPKGMQRKDGSLRENAMSDTSLLSSSCNNEVVPMLSELSLVCNFFYIKYYFIFVLRMNFRSV